jgi:hypothetical protein
MRQPTPRQIELLKATVELSVKVAARQLGIGESTIKNQLTLVYRNLGIDTRYGHDKKTAAAMLGEICGWLTVDETKFQKRIDEPLTLPRIKKIKPDREWRRAYMLR